METAVSPQIIHPYFRTSGYAHIHIPSKLAKECAIIPGNRVTFIVSVKDGRLFIEQVKEGKDAV